MKNLTALILSLAATLLFYHPVSIAVPLGNMQMVYVANSDGTFTYFAHLRNMGPPIGVDVATPPQHQIYDWRTQQSYPAGGKLLTENKNIITFGIDTKSDEVTISNVSNGFPSDFQGGEEDGFSDSDNDGVPNKTASWHLPFDFTLDQALGQGHTIWFLSFTLDRAISDFEYWVGGSDDAKIWDDTHIMLEDNYGIYDATDGAYLATFLTRSLKARKVPWNMLWKSFSY